MSIPADPWYLARWAREQAVEQELSATTAHLLLLLATYADKATGKCHPALRTIAAAARRGERVISDALKDLEERGLIERHGRGPGRTRATHLLAPVADSPADSQSTASQGSADPRPTAAKTRGGPQQRLAVGRSQDVPPENKPEERIGSPGRGRRAGAREGSRNGQDYQQLAREREEQPEASLLKRVCSILQGGVDSLQENDHGRPWPSPKRPAIAEALAGDPDPELAEKVAWEVREIVQAQDKAPNIAGLYAAQLKKAKRMSARSQISESLGASA